MPENNVVVGVDAGRTRSKRFIPRGASDKIAAREVVTDRRRRAASRSTSQDRAADLVTRFEWRSADNSSDWRAREPILRGTGERDRRAVAADDVIVRAGFPLHCAVTYRVK